MNQRFEKTTLIASDAVTVWQALTQPHLMKQWMGEPEMNIEVQTDWGMNSPIIIKGFHHARFENKGMVLEFEENKKLAYTHLSSMSRLEDIPVNYSVIQFELKPAEGKTELVLVIENFPTETIYHHLCFYWRGTAEKIKAFVENQVKTQASTTTF
jgi:uncharacterized protein YndB with AHSA1/START domain